MTVKLLTEHHLEFLSLKVGCTGSSESTLVKMSYCWKSHAAALLTLKCCFQDVRSPQVVHITVNGRSMFACYNLECIDKCCLTYPCLICDEDFD